MPAFERALACQFDSQFQIHFSAFSLSDSTHDMSSSDHHLTIACVHITRLCVLAYAEAISALKARERQLKGGALATVTGVGSLLLTHRSK